MVPERRLSAPNHNQIHEILMVPKLNIDNLWPLKITGMLVQEVIFGTLGNILNNRISYQMNILEKFYREHLRIWMLSANMVALLTMTGLRIRIAGMEMTDGKCLHNLIRRNGRGTSAIEPKQVA
jgi:hypothetical protein